MKPWIIAFLSLAGVLAIALCTPSQGAPENIVQHAPCERRSFEGDVFTVCFFDSSLQDFRLTLADDSGMPMRGFRQLAASLGQIAKRVRFGMNAGMFDSSARPVGLYIEAGKTLKPLNTGSGSGNFYLRPNGVLSVDMDRTVHIENSSAFLSRHASPFWATQSGPMLVINGAINPVFDPDGQSKFIRNGVGQLDAHETVFAISETPVSFGRFARFFRDALKCDNALYLDGAISSLWVPAAGRQDDAHVLGPMLVVLDRAP